MIASEARTRLEDAERLLSPGVARERALAELDELFRTGAAPEPPPAGFLTGRALASTIWGPLDALGRRLASVYMPWLGKSFATGKGVNVLTKAGVAPMKLIWPSYTPVREYGDRVEAFRFTTRLAPGALDAQTTVLKIDYALDENPAFIIRRVLDELVKLDDGLYLGKVLYRMSGRFRRIGFFTLEP